MIISQLKGGLGNQMFQYAAGRALAHLHNSDLKLDLSYLLADTKGTYTKRNYELNIFNLEAKFASESETISYRKNSENRFLRVLYREFPFIFKTIYAAENRHSYQTNFLKYPADTYLDGYWQSEKYFSFIEDIIRKDFSFKEPLSEINSALAGKIQNSRSVSLHIRRGDYTTDKVIQAHHGVCSPEYYKEAVKTIRENYKDPELFIFSDDAEWCRQNITFDTSCTYIDHNKGEKSFEDMRLMSLCKHNVIANSSFSWWGAWLNINKDKQVIAPKKWFQSAKSPDIYPKDWTQL